MNGVVVPEAAARLRLRKCVMAQAVERGEGENGAGTEYVAPRWGAKYRRVSGVSLGLQTYLDGAAASHENSRCMDLKKNPLHRWKPEFPKGGKRGAVCGFSAKSRLRLMRRVAQVRKGEPCHFVSLTVPFWMEPDDMKAALWAFWRRLERKYGEIAMLWKMEPQKRGVWHFHLMVFGIRFLPHRAAKAMWGAILSTQGIKGAFHRGVDVKWIDGDHKAVACYVTKYFSKECEEAELAGWTGRVWGVRGSLPVGELVKHGMDVKTLVWIWRLISRKRKVNVVRMSNVFFCSNPDEWIRAGRICAANDC